MAAKTEEKLVGRITHYYSHLGVGIIELTGGELKALDHIPDPEVTARGFGDGSPSM